MVEWVEKTLKGFPITNVAYNQSNSMVAVTSGCDIILHNLLTPNQKVFGTSSDPIVSIVFSGPEEILTISTSGELVNWNVTADVLTASTSRRVTAFSVKDVVFAAEGRESVWVVREGDKYSLYFLIGDQPLEKIADINCDLKKGQLALGDGFAVYCNEKKIHFVPTDQDSDISAHSFTYGGNINNLSAKENDENVFQQITASRDVVAASLKFGVKLIWHDVDQKGIQNGKNVYHQRHWHKVAPAMSLTPFGGLLSAGAETVLCKWTLSGSGPPTMLSRLAAPVESLTLSPDASLVALLLEDNSLHIISVGAMSFQYAIPTVSWCARSPNNVFTTDPLSNSLVLNSKPGSIQWLSPEDGATKKEARITLENAVDGDMPGLVHIYHDIEHICLTSQYAASLTSIVNYKEDQKRLRIWRRNVEDFSILELQETIAVSGKIKFLAGCLRPVSDDDNVFASSTENGEITIYKQWQQGERWRVDTSRNRRWQTSDIRCVSDIQSGPVWATAHKGVNSDNIVIWDVSNMSVMEAIPTDSPVVSIQWANSSHVVYATQESVTCWNILVGAMAWTVQQSLQISCGVTGCFAWEDMNVIQFDPFSGRLLDSARFSAPVQNLLAVPVELGSESVFLIAKTIKGFHVLSPPLDTKEPDMTPAVTPFGALLASVRTTEAVRAVRPQKIPKALDLMNAPCHTLPPLSHIAPMFISSCFAPLSNF